MNPEDYDDPEIEAEWIAAQRSSVLDYLERQEVRHTGVPEEPEWFVAPYVALWSVGSRKVPGTRGWWAISGDLPTDYLSGSDASDERSALDAFARLWADIADYMLRGEEHPTMSIGTPEKWPELGDLLQRRATALRELVDDDSLWE